MDDWDKALALLGIFGLFGFLGFLAYLAYTKTQNSQTVVTSTPTYIPISELEEVKKAIRGRSYE